MTERALIVFLITDSIVCIEEGFFNILKSYDVLIINDGFDDDIETMFNEIDNVRYIRHAETNGYGLCLQSAIKYASDYNYDIIVLMDFNLEDCNEHIQLMLDSISNGYDFVSINRINKNLYDCTIPAEIIHYSQLLHQYIEQTYGINVYDPLSPIKAIRLRSINFLEMIEDDISILIQLWTYAFNTDMSLLEIPSEASYKWSEASSNPIDYDKVFHVLETEIYIKHDNQNHRQQSH